MSLLDAAFFMFVGFAIGFFVGALHILYLASKDKL